MLHCVILMVISPSLDLELTTRSKRVSARAITKWFTRDEWVGPNIIEKWKCKHRMASGGWQPTIVMNGLGYSRKNRKCISLTLQYKTSEFRCDFFFLENGESKHPFQRPRDLYTMSIFSGQNDANRAKIGSFFALDLYRQTNHSSIHIHIHIQTPDAGFSISCPSSLPSVWCWPFG